MCLRSLLLLKIEFHSRAFLAALISSSRYMRFFVFSWMLRSRRHLFSTLLFCCSMNVFEGIEPSFFNKSSCWLISSSSALRSHLALYWALASFFLPEMSLFNCLMFIIAFFCLYLFLSFTSYDYDELISSRSLFSLLVFCWYVKLYFYYVVDLLLCIRCR